MYGVKISVVFSSGRGDEGFSEGASSELPLIVAGVWPLLVASWEVSSSLLEELLHKPQ
jgi:hypothetical protein